MPPKRNEKAVAATERKEAAKASAASSKQKEQEDAAWREAGEGAKSKAQAKKAEQEKQRAEAAAKKLEAKRLAEEEEAAMSKPKSTGKAPKVTGKVTHHQLQKQKEEEHGARAAAQREKQMALRREVDERAYGALVDTHVNTNREEDLVEARNLDEAIEALGSLGFGGEAATPDKHPEKRMKAAWLAYEKRELPALKEEKPGLKQQQYKDMLWKLWQKSPDNPMNQVAL
jgi:pyruvate/2-oxoglutarate dehydrogenase complex dihydrolipoamide acyltransferase (E2) component